MQQLIDKIKSRQKNGNVILTLGDMNYLPVIMNWIVMLHKLNIHNYVIVSLDNRLYNFLSSRGISIININDANLYSGLNIWMKRLHFFKILLKNNISFINSDADALWLKNPLSLFDTNNDIAISQGTIWPKTFYNRYGFVMCMGLVYFKSNNQVLKFFSDLFLKANPSNHGNDQKILNNFISSMNPNIKKLSDEFQISLSNPSLNIKVLSKNIVARVKKNKNDSTCIYHPFLPKKSHVKIKLFQKENVYYLIDNWVNVKYEGNVSDWIIKITKQT